MNYTSPSFLGAIGVATCLTSLAVAYFFLQQYLGLNPCPLCILDRWIIAALALGFLVITFSHNRIVRGCSLIWNGLFLIAAFAVGGRHLWLEATPAPPDPTGSCAPDEKSQAILDWLTNAFVGTSDCSIAPWRLFGISIAGWTMVLFAGLALLTLLATISHCKQIRANNSNGN